MTAFINRYLFSANAKLSAQCTAMIVVGAAYWLLLQFGLLLVIRPEGVASIWPASGFTLAILLLSPKQMRVKYLALFFITNTAGNLYGGNSFQASLGFALANVSESIVGAAIILFISKSKITFERTIEIFALFVAAVAGNAITALLGALVSYLATGAPFLNTWKLWWAADGLGIIVVTTLIVVWTAEKNKSFSVPRSRLYESIFIVFALMIFSWLLFGPFTVAEKPFIRTFMLFPILIWSAFRFSMRSMAGALFLIAIIAVWNTVLGYGTFAFKHQTVSENLVSVQLFLTVAVFSGLFLTTMILDRKQAEKALRESEKKLIEANKIAELGNWELNLLTSRLTWSEGIYEIFEINKNTFEATYKAFLHSIHPDDRERVDAAYTESLRNKSPYEISHRLLMPDGRIKWVNERCRTDYDLQGKAIRSFGILQDITERKRTDDALTASELKYRNLVENSAIGVFQSKVNGEIIYVNRAVTSILEFEQSEELKMLGSLVRYKYPEQRDEIIRLLKANGRIENYESELLTKDGNIRIVLFNIVITGDVMDGTLIDITERKNAEQALRNAQKLESIGTLAGGIAHDFNNLMNAVLGQSALALNKLPKESAAADQIAKAIKASERVADLTKQLLAYSGRGKFFINEIDLNKLVTENVQILEVSIPKTTKVRYDLGSPSPHFKGDISQIQQVIMNLIINAGEAMDPNPGTIILRTNRIEINSEINEYSKYTASPLAAGSYALLQVRDTGSGISQQTLTRIFDPFFTTKFTGRGLGLAAVLGIIKGHKGGLRIESEEGKGTLFEVIFPLVTSSTTADVPEKDKTSLVKGEGKSILVIDDEASVIELLADVFTENNFMVMSALDPVKGIEIYRQYHGKISMIVLDYSMPVMDGKAAFDELLKINNDVKVLLCSGYSEEETLSAFGIDRPMGFLQKPYKPDVLVQQVSKILSIDV